MSLEFGYLNNNNFSSRFPKNREICLKWKQFCGLREVDDVRAIYICSFHFRPEDFRIHTLAAKKHLLNPEAVPSIRSRKQQTLIVKNVKSLLTKESQKVNKDETVIEKPQLEVLRDNKEYIEPKINVPLSYSSVKIEPADVVRPIKDYVSSVNMPANISRKCHRLIYLIALKVLGSKKCNINHFYRFLFCNISFVNIL